MRSISRPSHELEASGQPVQDGAQTLKSHGIQKEATRIVCVFLTSNAIMIGEYEDFPFISWYLATKKQILFQVTLLSVGFLSCFVFTFSGNRAKIADLERKLSKQEGNSNLRCT